MHKLMEMTCEALEDIERSGDLDIMNTADRRLVSELVDLKKNILKVQKLEDEVEGYSEDDGMDYGRDSKRMDRRAHHDRDIGRDYSGRRDSRGRYSREGSREKMMEHVRMAIDAAPDELKGEMKRFFKDLEE